jgi:hypothetical protein
MCIQINIVGVINTGNFKYLIHMKQHQSIHRTALFMQFVLLKESMFN